MDQKAKEDKNSCPVPKGILLVVGGKEDKENQKNEKEKPSSFVPEEILKTFLEIQNCLLRFAAQYGFGERDHNRTIHHLAVLERLRDACDGFFLFHE